MDTTDLLIVDVTSSIRSHLPPLNMPSGHNSSVFLTGLLLNDREENTLVLHGEENVVKVLQNFFSKIQATSRLIIDAEGLPSILCVQEYTEILKQLMDRGVRRLCITEITKENLEYCKKLSKVIEIRHLDGIKGNFAVSETEYVASAIINQTKPIAQVIYSNAVAMVEQHQYLFETLWSKAIPAYQKISDIESGSQTPVTKILHDPSDIAKTFLNLIASAKKEILLLIPTENAFRREQCFGVIDLIQNAALERDVSVRILSPFDSSLAFSFDHNNSGIKGANSKNVQIKRIEEVSELETTLLLIDRRESLVVNLKDDQRQELLEAIGAAVYSDTVAMVASYVSIFESLWRESELYEEIRRANELLEVNDKLQKEFINIAAHELKTPVQPLLVLAELLESEVVDKSVVQVKRQDIELILRNAKRLERLTSDILDVSRIESSTLTLHKSKVDLDEIILSVLKDAKNRSTKVNMHFIPSGIVADDVDRDRIFQVIFNLVDNALKFTASTSGEIFVGVDRSDDAIVVSVSDTGPGIDPEIMPRLFTKFASRSENGTGLGLYISKMIVEAHGGKIWAQSKSDKDPDLRGATFSFSLPKNEKQA